MLATDRILTITTNAAAVALLSLAWHELTRPGKLLGWFAWCLNMAHEYLDCQSKLDCYKCSWWQIIRAIVITAASSLYSFLTYSLRECFACLAGQLAIIWWLAIMGIPTNTVRACELIALASASILFTYPINRFIHGKR